MKDIITVFHDGSIECQVLLYELKEQDEYIIHEVPVEKAKYWKLADWVDQVKNNQDDPLRIFLHFPYEDYITSDLRTEMMELEHENKRLRLIPYYEQADRTSLHRRAEKYGIKEQEPPVIYVGIKTKDEVKEVKTRFRPGQIVLVDDKVDAKIGEDDLEFNEIHASFAEDKPSKKRGKKTAI
jgi:hypothetical protein